MKDHPVVLQKSSHRRRRWTQSPRALLVAVAFATVAFIPAGSSGAEELELDGMQSLQTTERIRIHSDSLETTYTLLVRAPIAQEEDSEPAKPLPVVYLLDGGATFPALAAYYHYLHLGEELPNLILVGISYGTDDYREGNQRGRDFTAPTEEREHWGGIGPFLGFVEERVFPVIEERFGADPQRRILFGQSLGGQAVLWAAQFRPGLFWGHISSNPALHRNLDLFLQPAAGVPQDEDASAPIAQVGRLFVASGSEDDPRFRGPALKWIEHWNTTDHPWALATRTLDGHGHFSALPASFRDGLRWLLAEP